MTGRFTGCAVCCALMLCAVQSQAQPSLDPQSQRPWAHGVSEREQAVALETYRAGNREFVDEHYVKALAMYKDAIRHWDHPAIRFNMAVSLINLDKLVEARENLEKSLAYGAPPLGGEMYKQARRIANCSIRNSSI